MAESADNVTIFVSYAHEDDVEREVLTDHLSQIPGVSVWDDRAIPPGSEWDDLITERLESADMILLLISRNFLRSDYVKNVEIARAAARHDAGSAIVIPVLVKNCIWEPTLGRYQALPSDEKLPEDKNWLTSDAWTLDEACYHVAKGVMKQVDRLRETRKLQLQRRKENEETYRKKVAKFIADDGEISDIERDTLEELRDQLTLSREDADRIEQGELWPIKEKRQNLDKYEMTLRREIQKGYPFSPSATHDLTRRQEDLLLTDSEVGAIEKRVIDEWRAGVLDEARAERIEREAAEAAAEAEAERAAEAERVAAEQAEAERVTAEQAEAERVAAERAAVAEAERVAAERAAVAEAERAAVAEAERAAVAEAERVAAEQAAAAGSLGGVLLSRQFDHGAPVTRVAHSADGSWIASVGSDQRVAIWSVSSDEPVMSWTIPSPALDISLDAQGAHVAVATAGCAWVYATDSGQTRAVLAPGKEKKSEVTAVAFDRSGSTLVAGNAAGTVEAWRSADWDGVSVHKALRGAGAITRIRFPLVGDVAFLASPAQLSWWGISTGAHSPLAVGDGVGEIGDFAVSADGRLAAVGTTSGVLLLIDLTSGAIVQRTTVPASITTCDIAPDGAMTVVSGSDGTLHVWAGERETHAASLDVDRVTAVRFLSSTTRLLTAGGDGLVRLWVSPSDA